MTWQEIGESFGHAGVYWLNFWRLALTYILGQLWFFLCLGGFFPLLRAAMQHEAQARVQLHDPTHSISGMDQAYQPHNAEQLRQHLRRRR